MTTPTREEVLTQTERICGFMPGKKVLVRLLKHLVAAALDGRKVTEHELGVKVFDKFADWNAQSDAVVRVNMGRLRKAVAAYYQSDGMDDTVRVILDHGTIDATLLKQDHDVVVTTRKIWHDKNGRPEPMPAAPLPVRLFFRFLMRFGDHLFWYDDEK